MAGEGLNKVQLIGNLGQDPELKFTANGQAIMRLRMATTERYLSRDGEKQERTEWHSVNVWGPRAEALNKFLTKGHTLYIEGRLQTRQFEDREGNKRSITDIVAGQILVLGGGQRPDGDQRSAREKYAGEPEQDPIRDRVNAARQAAGRTQQQDDFTDFGDDDIPF